MVLLWISLSRVLILQAHIMIRRCNIVNSVNYFNKKEATFRNSS